MNSSKIQGFIRHALGAVGAWAVGRGYVDESTATQLVGAGATLIAFLWSWFAPEKGDA